VLQGARLRGANLQGADLTGADLTGADLRGAVLKGARVSGASLATANLQGADLEGLRDWESLGSVSYARIDGVRHAPPGWIEWMLARGAGESIDSPESEGQEPSFSQDWRVV
jgi:Pentapeptide repeats (8 copies)